MRLEMAQEGRHQAQTRAEIDGDIVEHHCIAQLCRWRDRPHHPGIADESHCVPRQGRQLRQTRFQHRQHAVGLCQIKRNMFAHSLATHARKPADLPAGGIGLLAQRCAQTARCARNDDQFFAIGIHAASSFYRVNADPWQHAGTVAA